MKKIKLLLIKTFKGSLLLGVLCASLYVAYLMGKTREFTVQAEQIDNLPAKIETLKDDLVNRLAVKCESVGHKDTDGLIIFDSNRVASIGPLQFQVLTVKHYVSELYGRQITGQEAVEIAIDGTKARSLAKDIIFKTKNGVVGDWTNCSKKFNLQAEVDIIKKISN